MRATCIWPLSAELAEGPWWDDRRSALWFVDIMAGRVHRCDASGGDRRTFEIGGHPSFILPTADGDMVIGNRDRLLRFDGERVTGEVGRVAMRERDRLNDATVDARGRLWFGSMDMDEAAATGMVHVHSGGEIAVAGGASVITNGPAVTRDGRRLYHVDTVERAIWRFDVAAGETLDDAEPFVRIEDDAGNPDGVTIDAEDHLWVALWGGWGARRYAPDGRLVDEIRLPCANVTKLALGGPDRRTAFVTTAWSGPDAAALAEQPLAGGIFAVPVAVPGVAMPAARLRA